MSIGMRKDRSMSSLNDKQLSVKDWPYDDPPNVAVFTTRSVVADKLLIKYVYHEQNDGAWQFYASANVTLDDVIIVSLAHVARTDPSVKLLADLPLGWFAYRPNAKAEWHRAPNDSDES
jgi:hypothetical protein